MARVDLGLSDEEFLLLAPVSLHALTERLTVRDKKLRYHAAILEAAIYNVNRDSEKRPEPFTANDFMPDESRHSEQDEMKEFVLAVERGEFEEPDPAQVKAFTQGLMSQFRMKQGIVRTTLKS